jgi:GH24 family phage-related lysozyme (muramidase)
MAYRLSDKGLEELKRMEGVRYAVYDDKTGKPINSYEEAGGTPTIGMGLAIQSAEDRERYRPYLGNRKASQAVIDEANRQKVAQFEAKLNQMFGGVKLTPAMFDAIFHFAWNIGTGSRHLKNVASALTQKDAEGKPAPDYQKAQKAIADGPKSGVGIGYMEALAKRRAKEAALFLSEGMPKGGLSIDVDAILKSPYFYVGVLGFVGGVLAIGVKRRRSRVLVVRGVGRGRR